MSPFLIGAILICASPLAFTLSGFGISSTVYLTLFLGMALVGFGLQVHVAFSLRRSWLNSEYRLKQYDADRKAFINTAKGLSPTEKIALLLQRQKDEIKL